MKKTLILLLVFLISLSLVACKNSGNNSDSAVSSDKENSSADSKVTYTEKDAKSDANGLFDNLNKIDKLGGSAIEYDESDTFTQGKGTYCKVTDKNYTSVKQIKDFMEENLTENLINGRYATILGTELPCYVEKDGKLYALIAGKGCGFVFTADATVSDFNDNGFTAMRQIDNYNAVATLKIKAVIDNGKPKIDSLEIIEKN